MRSCTREQLAAAWPSPKHGSRVRFICTGPSGPRPGRALHVALLDESEESVVAELRERRGECAAGYVSFFPELARSGIYVHEFVDEEGTVLFASTEPSAMNRWIRAHFGEWVAERTRRLQEGDDEPLTMTTTRAKLKALDDFLEEHGTAYTEFLSVVPQ